MRTRFRGRRLGHRKPREERVMSAQIPSKAVSAKEDVVEPTQAVLQGLQLLGPVDDKDKKDGDGLGSVFTGPPQSVALIEAGATAVAKWWAAGAGAVIVAAWTTVFAWWDTQDIDLKTAVVFTAGIVTAALILAIGHLLASDVRGRGQGAAATIEARSRVALAMLTAVETLYQRPDARVNSQLIPLSPARDVVIRNTGESGWSAMAMKDDGSDSVSFLIVKGSDEKCLKASDLIFVAQAHPRALAVTIQENGETHP